MKACVQAHAAVQARITSGRANGLSNGHFNSHATEPLLGSPWHSNNKQIVSAIMEDPRDDDKHAEARHILRRENSLVPLRTLSVLVLLFIWVLASDSLKNIVRCGGATYWALVLSVVPLVAGMLVVTRQQLMRKRNVKREVRAC